MMTGRLLSTDLPRRQQRRFSNFVSPAVAISFPKANSTGVAANPHLRDAGQFQYPDAADRLGYSSLRRAPRGSVLGRCRTFVLSLTKRPEPGSFAPCEVSKSLPVIGFHVPEHGEADEQDVAENLRGFANVCS